VLYEVRVYVTTHVNEVFEPFNCGKSSAIFVKLNGLPLPLKLLDWTPEMKRPLSGNYRLK